MPKIKIVAAFCAGLLASTVSQAAVVWSSCQSITAVTNEPVSSTILLTLSPGIAGCSAQGVTGAVGFVVGQAGLSATNMSSLLATSLSAVSLGRKVLIGYDNSSSNCYSSSISIGGYLV